MIVLNGGTTLWGQRGAQRVVERTIVVDGGVISDAETAGSASATQVDCRGLTILPGIVDVHGDAFERELFPRPGVDMATPIALQSVDRQLASNGITTAYHGLTVSWEPGQRSHAAGQRFMAALAEQRQHLTADHRVQIRWETFALEAVDTVADWLIQTPRPALAFNDHTTSTLRKIAEGRHEKLEQWATRAGLTTDAYLDACQARMNAADTVPAAIDRLAETARAIGVVMLSHDDRTLDERALYRARGATVCEFPLSETVAADAKARSEPIVLGGPNVLRGGSHTGALSATDAIRRGECSVLASDYYYPSLFHAAVQLARTGVRDLADAWRLVSTHAADAMALTDRGAL
ncbi:MAG: alpha-D-ribose 1-methylphosphonate 5-triphosphate diphosphatase, partial [Pseudomonadota bacterium]